jgi:hypothetical protein
MTVFICSRVLYVRRRCFETHNIDYKFKDTLRCEIKTIFDLLVYRSCNRPVYSVVKSRRLGTKVRVLCSI